LIFKTTNFVGVFHFSLWKFTNPIEICLGLANFTLAAIPSWFVSFTKLKVPNLNSNNFIEELIPKWVQMMLGL
jgi:hypothetical protein